MSEPSENLSNWIRAPETMQVVAVMVAERKKTFDSLLGAARESTDPKVRGLAWSLFEQDKGIGMLGGTVLATVVQRGR